MNDSFLASLVASSIFFALALYAMQRGWLRVPVQGGELQQLREQVDKLQILLDYAEEERDKTSRQLAKALRRVEALEKREKELQSKIDALTLAIDNRINKVSVLGIWAGTGISVAA